MVVLALAGDVLSSPGAPSIQQVDGCSRSEQTVVLLADAANHQFSSEETYAGAVQSRRSRGQHAGMLGQKLGPDTMSERRSATWAIAVRATADAASSDSHWLW